jgi:putative oxidoreductase
MKKYLLHFFDINCCHAIGLLVLRIGVSASLMTHGYGKLMNYESLSTKFMSHLFLSSEFTLSLVIFAELFCAFFVLIGFGTRIFSIPVMYNFIIAITVAHAADPFGKMEKAVLFLIVFTTFFILGPGKYSVDYYISKKIK